MPYQLHCSPFALEVLLETDDLLEEVAATDELDLTLEELEITVLDELDLTLEELEVTVVLDELLLTLEELLLTLDELAVPPKLVANLDVAFIPFALLIRKLPHVLRFAGSKLIAISKAVQQLPLPLQLQPM